MVSQQIESHLDSISELFTIPAPDPFSVHVRFLPEIEVIRAALTRNPLRWKHRARVTIYLPRDHIEPDLAQRTQEAIRRYCRFKSQQNHSNMVALRRGALEALLAGILFLSAGILFSAYLGKGVVFPPFFHILFSDGFDIAFWVILWRPVDFFLFDASTFWREDQINRRLMALEVVIAEEPTP